MALLGWLGGLGFLPLRRKCSGPAASLMQQVVVSAITGLILARRILVDRAPVFVGLV